MRETQSIILGLVAAAIMALLPACTGESHLTRIDDGEADSPDVVGSGFAAIHGIVLSDAGLPLGGARIDVAGQEATSGDDGRFEFDALPAGVQVSISARLDGWSTTGQRLTLVDGAEQMVMLHVAPASSQLLTDAWSGGWIDGDDGVSISFPEASLFGADGQAVDGDVTVEWTLLDEPSSIRAAPGGMIAQDEDSEFPLESFGMVEVQLSQDGEPVTFDGLSDLSLPLAESAEFSDGEEVPLWTYDEDSAAWVQEGTGVVTDGAFSASVSHYTWWNCDVPMTVVCYDGVAVLDDGRPLSHGEARGDGVDYMGTSFGTLHDDGSFRLNLRIGSEVSLAIAGATDNATWDTTQTLHTDPEPTGTQGPCIDLGTIVIGPGDDDGDQYSELDGDCDDEDPSTHPEAMDVPDDGVDQDCNGVDAVTCWLDVDHDGWGAGDPIVEADGVCDGAAMVGVDGDCGETHPDVHPGAIEVCDSVLDNDCDGVAHPDETDDDGDGLSECAGDCDDLDANLSGVCEWSHLAPGGSFTCGIRTDGKVRCWGGLADDPDWVDAYGSFTEVVGGTDFGCGIRPGVGVECWDFSNLSLPEGDYMQMTGLSVSTTMVCGIQPSGEAACWGAPMSSPSSTFEEVAAGHAHVCGRDAAGAIDCWGSNALGQSNAPVGFYSEVVAGLYHSCGLRTDGTVVCWGDSTDGKTSPPAVALTDLAAGWDHTCGLDTAGEIVCWGRDTSGELGAPAGTWEAIYAGGSHSCALAGTGEAACWGDNGEGQLDMP